ncbi:MAG: type II restriction endonuclease [Candidatus Cloacimonetes bacterium]|nr:type II restriction endonuclease [Candidatus Cloacimonadota bacterium]
MKKEAKKFSIIESKYEESSIYSTSDGRAIGTYLEHKFQAFLERKYTYARRNSARGKDFPDESLNTDIKVTSINQPQSSCPFKSARQKIFGLGYNLLLFVYEKIDNITNQKSRLIYFTPFS